MAGTLFIVATPIGNLEDISPRALRILREAGLIAAEDTRRMRALLSRFEIPAGSRLLSCHQSNEAGVCARLVSRLSEGVDIALCSEGGYPGISDPGYRVITAAVDADVPIVVIPGPSAVPVALLLSGLPTSSYTFKGFPPRKPGRIKRFLEADREAPHTLVLFESPFRVAKTLQAAHEVLGDRRAAVCLELTKKFERVSRGTLSELAAEYADQKIKGEATIVIAGNNPKLAAPES